jgi:hypothetical protein
MNPHILVAILAAVLNVILSSIVPCLLKKSNETFLQQVRKVFETNRQVILTSSLIVGLTTFVALKLADEINFSNDNDNDLLDNMEPLSSNNIIMRLPRGFMNNNRVMNNNSDMNNNRVMTNMHPLSMLGRLYNN